MEGKKQNDSLFNFRASEHLKEEIAKAAKKAGLKPGTFVKAVVKKYIKYKEPELV